MAVQLFNQTAASKASTTNNSPASSRRDFLKGGALATAALCYMPSMAKAAKLLSMDAAANPAILVLGRAYAGLADACRRQQLRLSYTTRELRCRLEGNAFTRFELRFSQSGTKQMWAVQKKIECLARGMDFDVGQDTGFEPTLVLHQGAIYADENLIAAVKPLCAAVANEHEKISGGALVRAITLSAKAKAAFHPQVVIS